MKLHVKSYGALTKDELFDLLKLRCEVFIVEQESPYQDVDDADKLSTHVWFEDEDGSVAAVARIVPAGVNFDTTSIGRVIARDRGCGMGSKIMQAAIDQLDGQDITIEAQCQAKGFYEKFGFVQDSEPFDDCGVMHIRMVRKA